MGFQPAVATTHSPQPLKWNISLPTLAPLHRQQLYSPHHRVEATPPTIRLPGTPKTRLRATRPARVGKQFWWSQLRSQLAIISAPRSPSCTSAWEPGITVLASDTDITRENTAVGPHTSGEPAKYPSALCTTTSAPTYVPGAPPLPLSSAHHRASLHQICIELRHPSRRNSVLRRKQSDVPSDVKSEGAK